MLKMPDMNGMIRMETKGEWDHPIFKEAKARLSMDLHFFFMIIIIIISYDILSMASICLQLAHHHSVMIINYIIFEITLAPDEEDISVYHMMVY